MPPRRQASTQTSLLESLQPPPSNKSAFYIRLDSSGLPTGLLDSRLRVPGSPELRLVIVSRVPEKGAFRSVLVGVCVCGGELQNKTHHDNTLGVFNTETFLVWCFIRFLLLPPHTGCREEIRRGLIITQSKGLDSAARQAETRVCTQCTCPCRPTFPPLGTMWPEGHVSLPGACVGDLCTCCPCQGHTGTQLPEGTDTASGDPISLGLEWPPSDPH